MFEGMLSMFHMLAVATYKKHVVWRCRDLCQPPTRLINRVEANIRKMAVKLVTVAVSLCILLQGIILHVI